MIVTCRASASSASHQSQIQYELFLDYQRLERWYLQAKRQRGRSLGPDGWTDGSRLCWALHILVLSKRPADWIPQLLRNFITPADLIDVQSGTYGSIPHRVRRRCAKLRPRLSETNRSQTRLVGWEMSALNRKRVTGFEPATFSLGRFSIDWPNCLCCPESHKPSGLDARRSVRRFWPRVMAFLAQQRRPSHRAATASGREEHSRP